MKKILAVLIVLALCTGFALAKDEKEVSWKFDKVEKRLTDVEKRVDALEKVVDAKKHTAVCECGDKCECKDCECKNCKCDKCPGKTVKGTTLTGLVPYATLLDHLTRGGEGKLFIGVKPVGDVEGVYSVIGVRDGYINGVYKCFLYNGETSVQLINTENVLSAANEVRYYRSPVARYSPYYGVYSTCPGGICPK